MMIRMFIDPGSKCSGWSIWDDKKLVASGYAECQDGPVHKRIGIITDKLKEVANEHKPEEAFLERLNRRTHVYCLWACGAAIYSLHRLSVVDDAISVSSWKSYFGLKQVHKGPEVRAAFAKHFGSYDGMSDDQIEAILMGAYYTDYLSKRGNDETNSRERKTGSGKDLPNKTVKAVRSKRHHDKSRKVRRSALSTARPNLRSRRNSKTEHKR